MARQKNPSNSPTDAFETPDPSTPPETLDAGWGEGATEAEDEDKTGEFPIVDPAVVELQDQLASANERIVSLEMKLAAREEARKNPFAGTTPTVLHVSGTPWANNERKLVRCGADGELADSWLVQVGDQLLLADGRSTIPAQPYLQLAPKLRERVRFPLASAIEAAQTYQGR